MYLWNSWQKPDFWPFLDKFQELKSQKIMGWPRTAIDIDHKTELLWKEDNAVHSVRL